MNEPSPFDDIRSEERAQVRNKIVRRYIPRTRVVFDEQQWPVNIALVVLGGFLVGGIFAYQPFDPEAAWYASPWVSLLIVLLLICSSILTFRYIDNKKFKRTMQFSVIVCAIIHLMMLVYALEAEVFSKGWRGDVAQKQLVKKKPKKRLEYHPSHQQQNVEKPDFLKPVETEVPDPQPPEVDRRQETQMTEKVQQPTVEQNEPQPIPEIVEKRSESSDSLARQADATSKLSRNSVQLPKLNNPATDVVQPTRNTKATQPRVTQAPSRNVARSQAADNLRKMTVPVEADIPLKADANNSQRAESQTAQVTNDAQQKSAARQETKLTDLPKTQATPVPNQTVQTQAKETPLETPKNTLAQQQRTATPDRNPEIKNPTPIPVQVVDSQMVNRESPSREQQNIAKVPTPAVNPRSQRVPRDVPVVQPVEITQTATTEAPSQVNPRTNTAVQRANTDNPQMSPSKAPSESTNPVVSSSVNRQNSTQPNPQITADSSRPNRRSSELAAVTPPTQPVENVKSGQTNKPAPTLTASAVDTPQKQQSPTRTTNQSNAQNAANATVKVAAQTTNRAVTSREQSNPNAQSAQNSPINRQQSAAASIPNPTTTATDLQRPTQLAQASPNPNAAKGNVARENTNQSTNQQQQLAAVDNNAADIASGSNLTQRRESQQTSQSDSENQNSAPQRSSTVAAALASPTNADNPANASSLASNDSPSLEASQRVTSRANDGQSGAASGQNLAELASAADSQTQVADSAAARAESTRNQDANSDNSSQSSQVQRNRTQTDIASAIRTPNKKADAAVLAANQPSQETLEASASPKTSAAREAATGDLNAMAGAASADTGEPNIKSEESFSRAAGGGSKQLSNESDNSEVSRNVSGRNLESLATNTKAETAASPEGAGGTPAASTLTSNEEAAAKAESGELASLAGDRSENEADNEDQETLGQIAQTDIARKEDSRSGPEGASTQLDEAMTSSGKAVGRTTTIDNAIALNAVDVDVAAAAPQAGEGEPVASATSDPGGAAGEQSAVQRASTTGTVAAAEQLAEAGGPDAPMAEKIQRATGAASANDAKAGATAAGGGTAAPMRTSRGAPLNALADVPEVMVEGAATSGGAEQGSQLVAQSDTAADAPGGIRAQTDTAETGGPAGDTTVEGQAEVSGTNIGSRNEKSSDAEGDGQQLAESGGSNVGRTERGGPSLSDFGPVAVEVADAGNPSPGEMEDTELAGGYTEGPVAQPFAEPVPVNATAEEGLGGLGEQLAADAGITDRRASQDSATIQLRPSRFQRDGMVDLPALNTHATVAKEGFEGRRNRAGGNGAAEPETEEAIEKGLAFLARFQRRDGSWSLQQFAAFDGVSVIDSDTAATGLCMLAFQGAGYNHQQYQYKDLLQRSVNFILANQQANGDYYIAQGNAGNQVARLYSHAIATLAMCEAYGMTQDPRIKDSVQQALNFIIESQHVQRGGWRYIPGREADLSVTGWMLMAVESGKRAGLEIPDETYDGIGNFLDAAQNAKKPYLYAYNPYAPSNARQGQGRVPSKTMTSVGLLMRLYTGMDKHSELAESGALYLGENLPSIRRTKDASLRDTYYWYYATQFMYHMGGEHWKRWNDRLHPLLVNGQEPEGDLAGSWDPRRPVPDRWGPHAGRLYVTTMNLLSLEVHYRHLPLYENKKDSDNSVVPDQDQQ
ncbi:MAG: hypothetical protein CMJ76_15775 [Planctomycetaceae bacterium]|nr:hypothetical protein [Planctomycetaceae bacterium]